jgi:nitrate reductase delta subunit
MMFYRIASALLGYPDADLRAALAEIGQAVATGADIESEERAVLDRFIVELDGRNPTAAEEEYVRTFDMVPEHSLSLTHHLIGADRNRGPAMIGLTEFYGSHGFEIAEKELPDYLPLLLEFVSLLDVAEGKAFLARWNKVLRQLRANLAEADSPYADLIGLIEKRSRLAATDDDCEIVPAVPKTDPCLDDGDFDPPVTWTGPAAASPCASSTQPAAGTEIWRR